MAMADQQSAFELLSDDLELSLSAKYPTGLPKWASSFLKAVSASEEAKQMEQERLAKARRESYEYYLTSLKSEELKRLEAELDDLKAQREKDLQRRGELMFVQASFSTRNGRRQVY